MACTTLSGNMYSGGSNAQADVARLQAFFISRGYLRGTVNGYFDQATLTALQRFQADNGLPVTGVVDSQTRSVIQQMSCVNAQNGYQNTNGQLSIQGIDAPRQLSVGQTGTWTVRVAGWNGYQSGGQLHYNVTWGDENSGMRQQAVYYPSTSVQSSGTFTHVFTRTGSFNPVFTVTDDYGHRVQVNVTTQVTGATTYGGYTGTPNYGTNCTNYYASNCVPTTGYTGVPAYTGTPSYSGNYTGNYSGGYPSGCTGYYDRSCYVNGRYMGPGTGGTFNGPGDSSNYTNTPSYDYYNQYPYTSGSSYGSTYGTSNTVDYSCYYDRACLARMNGTYY